MCELLGMSANVPTDICFSFAGLMQRGGNTGPHSDGWGIAFYEGKSHREFKSPTASAQCKIAQLVKTYPIKSHVVISHIRQANSGRVCLDNTHPFSRELWGKQWVYAHNGQLKKGQLKSLFQSTPIFYRPIGSTDSELAFCWILNSLREQFDTQPSRKLLTQFIREKCDVLSELGVFNILLSDSSLIFAYCGKSLCWITRKAPFGKAVLSDDNISVNFKNETTSKDIVSVIATKPLTNNEDWITMKAGDLAVFNKGKYTRG